MLIIISKKIGVVRNFFGRRRPGLPSFTHSDKLGNQDRVYMKTTRLAFVWLFVCAATWAQGTSQIQGVVRDASGLSVPGAEVKATQTDTSTVRTATSGADGVYVLANLPIGPYRLEVAKSGFAS